MKFFLTHFLDKSIGKTAALALAMTLAMPAWAYDKIVVLSPDVGDVVVALGAANKVIGKDDTNKNPALKNAKTIGMHRNLTIEPIVALKPDLVIGSYMAQPDSLYQRLQGFGLKAVNVAPSESLADYAKSINAVGALIEQSPKAKVLANNWLNGMKQKSATKKRYLLSYDGQIVAGKGTVGDTLITLAGGINAANFGRIVVDGLKPLSREGWLAAAPDVIIIAKHNEKLTGSVAGFKKRPEIMGSNAAKTGKIYYWHANDFLRYGLDSPQTVDKLHQLAK